jgi:hypothetical protein
MDTERPVVFCVFSLSLSHSAQRGPPQWGCCYCEQRQTFKLQINTHWFSTFSSTGTGSAAGALVVVVVEFVALAEREGEEAEDEEDEEDEEEVEEGGASYLPCLTFFSLGWMTRRQ